MSYRPTGVLGFAFGLAIGAGCTSSDKTEIGDTTVGTNTFHVFREGPAPAAGVMTDLVMKPTAGDMPTSIVGWVGVTADVPASSQIAGDYDSNDGDYDFAMTCPTQFDPASKFWFTVVTDGVTTTGSIDLK